MLKEAAQYNAKLIEQDIQKFWEETDAYSQVRELRKDGKKFNMQKMMKKFGM